MAETAAQTNARLYRDVLPDNKYDKYFGKNQCTPQNVGYGNTRVGLELMKQTVLKFANHTKSLADNEFDGKKLSELVNELHFFAYNHFQYKLDEEFQDLRSPNCAWSSRYDGLDCKSYSIIISTILYNLKINHSFRRVKYYNQAHGFFSHVYVVIPKDQQHNTLSQGYYVVDGTVYNNEEQVTKEIDDMSVEPSAQYRMLGAPSQSTFKKIAEKFHGASYPGQHATELGRINYNNSVLMAQDNFDFFLASYAVPEQKAHKLRQLVYDDLIAGNDPTIKIDKTGIYINHNFVNLSNEFSKSHFGLGNTTGENFDISDNFDVGDIVGDNFFGNTFGAIFANGLMLSCWNSSFLPQNTATEVKNIIGPYFEDLFMRLEEAPTVEQLEIRINFLSKAVYVCRDMYWFLRTNNNWRKCTRLALDKFNELFYELVPAFEAVITALSIQFTVNQIGEGTAPTAWVFEGYNHEWSENSTATYPIFTIEGDISNIPIDVSTPINTPIDISTPINIVTGGNDSPGDDTKDDEPTKKMGTGTMIGIAAVLLAGGIMLSKSNNNARA